MKNATQRSEQTLGTAAPLKNGNSQNGVVVASSSSSSSPAVPMSGFVASPGGHEFSRQALVRLLMQTANELGLQSSVSALASESGIAVEPPSMADLREAVRQGQWPRALRVCNALTRSRSSREHHFPIARRQQIAVASRAEDCARLLLTQHYLELLERGQVLEAVTLLRAQVTPLCMGEPHHTQQLHHLASLIMFVRPIDQQPQEEQEQQDDDSDSDVYDDAQERRNLNAALHMSLAQHQDTDSAAIGDIDMDLNPQSDEFFRAAQWDGSRGRSRAMLLESLEALLGPDIILPQRRLLTLLDQAVLQQVSTCPWFNPGLGSAARRLSLLADNDVFSPSEALPSQTYEILALHRDEVWALAWAHDGRRLASASKDRTIRVWDTSRFINGGGASDDGDADQSACLLCVNHGSQAGEIAWSPCDRFLLSCSAFDGPVMVWDSSSGESLATIGPSLVEPCVAWLPSVQLPDGCGPVFATASVTESISFWDIAGKRRGRIASARRVQSLAVSSDGQRLVVASRDGQISVFALTLGDDDRVKANPTHRFLEQCRIMGLALGQDDRHLLVSLSNTAEHIDNNIIRSNSQHNGSSSTTSPTTTSFNTSPPSACLIHLVDLDAPLTPQEKIVRQFVGPAQSKFVVRSCFGGRNDCFVASGSEDSQVYLWHRRLGPSDGTPVQVLSGHSGTISAVSWCPAHPHLLASASDDRTVRIWGLPDATRRVPTLFVPQPQSDADNHPAGFETVVVGSTDGESYDSQSDEHDDDDDDDDDDTSFHNVTPPPEDESEVHLLRHHRR